MPKAKEQQPTAFDPEAFGDLRWRNIGPMRGGRVVAVAGDPTSAGVFYFGAASGGVWKTTDGGTYWDCVSDGFFATASVGALAVARSDPNVVYAGMGECCIRNYVSHGDGVYRSTDAGRTWTHMGLETTRSISRVRVHTSDPDLVYVAALGDIFGPSGARGVYRSRDGGSSWDLVLHRSAKAGAADLWLDPTNPRVLFCAIWEAERKPWTITSGGPDSSLYRSVDGGETWQDITTRPGLPASGVLKGRMGVCGSPARPGRVWALLEAADDKGGLYRSEDNGDTWDRVSQHAGLTGRPWYYSHIVPDPQDTDTIWSCNFSFWKSSDGGVTFAAIPTPHGDNHDLWIDPNDNRRMIEGNDGGACVSFNGGQTFSTLYNQPTSQHYRIDVDRRVPYRVYGTQQDNSAVSVPSRSRRRTISWDDSFPCGFSESGHIQVDPRSPNVVYSGSIGSSPGGGGALTRYDHGNGNQTLVTVWPEYYYGEGAVTQRYRFNWTYPLLFSPHDPKRLYACGERVFVSTNEGQSWQAISPDLTRRDESKMAPSGGPITLDASGAEHFCTIFAFTESPHAPGVLWAGTDDGLVKLSRNGGKTWRDVTPPELGEWALVQTIECSPFHAGTVYVAATRYKLQDYAPYLFKTTDYGRTWTRITDGIPADDFTRVVRADPVRRGLLYAGTETRVYVSFDDGGSWQVLSLNLPAVPVYDMKVAGDDLVAGTHGRGFWILDEVSVLRGLADGLQLFAPASVVRWSESFGMPGELPGRVYVWNAGMLAGRKTKDGRTEVVVRGAGANPPAGIPVSYVLPDEPPVDGISLTVLDARGAEIATFTPEPEPSEAAEDGDKPPEPPKPRWWEILPRKKGFNRFHWLARYPGVRSLPDDDGRRVVQPGPLAPPGRYELRLRVGEETLSSFVELVPDPSGAASARDMQAQFKLLMQIRDAHQQAHDAIVRIRHVKDQLGPVAKRKRNEDLASRAKEVVKRLTAIEERLSEPKLKGTETFLAVPAGLDAKLADLSDALSYGETRPPRQFHDVYEHLSGRVRECVDELESIVSSDIAELNGRIRQDAVFEIETDLKEE